MSRVWNDSWWEDRVFKGPTGGLLVDLRCTSRPYGDEVDIRSVTDPLPAGSQLTTITAKSDVLDMCFEVGIIGNQVPASTSTPNNRVPEVVKLLLEHRASDCRQLRMFRYSESAPVWRFGVEDSIYEFDLRSGEQRWLVNCKWSSFLQGSVGVSAA